MDEFAGEQEHLFVGRGKSLVVCPVQDEYALVQDRKCELCGENV